MSAAMYSGNSHEFWSNVIAAALSSGSVTVPKVDSDGNEVPRPEESGLFKKSVGEPKGQIGDWRASIPYSERGVHVVEFPGRYTVHIDRFDPSKHPVLHLVMDSPMTLMSIIAAGLGSILLFGLFRRR